MLMYVKVNGWHHLTRLLTACRQYLSLQAEHFAVMLQIIHHINTDIVLAIAINVEKPLSLY
jgi:hypothetical protein